MAETLDRLGQDDALTKGRQVFVSGRLDAREYQDQQEQWRNSLDVAADNVQLIRSDPTFAAAGAHAEPTAQAVDCPF